jgi:hypothetical protein
MRNVLGPRLNCLALACWQDFGNLRGINRHGHVSVDDLQFSPSGLVRDCHYLSLDNFAAIKADPDAEAYAVIHMAIILASSILSREAEMTLILIAARLRHLAASIEALPAADRDIPDEIVAKLVAQLPFSDAKKVCAGIVTEPTAPEPVSLTATRISVA